MTQEELQKKFDDNVAWMQRNVPPDDIYLFAEQTKMAAAYFIRRWAEWVDIAEEAKKDPVANLWLNNISGLVYLQDHHMDIDEFKVNNGEL